MKKKLLLSIVTIAVVVSVFSMGVLAAPVVKLIVNGKNTSLGVKVINNVNYVPLNKFAELLGQTVSVDKKKGTITVAKKTAPTPSPKATPSAKLFSAPTMFNYSINSADGIKLTWLTNYLGSKTIKYYTVNISTYNAVGDPSYDQLSGKSKFNQKYVGPVAKGEQLVMYNLYTYQSALHKIVIDSVDLEYMDGTKEKVDCRYVTTDSSGF